MHALTRAASLAALALVACTARHVPTGGGSDASAASPVDAASDAALSVPADAGAPTDAGPHGLLTSDQVLFVGNSYVYVNDLPGAYRGLASAYPIAPLRIESVAIGGYTLAQHAADAMKDGTPLARWLRTGTAADRRWDVVVLQEQSQIPGFPNGDPDKTASLAATSTLGALAKADGAAVVLYLSWGRRAGDPMNATLFPDFSTMERRLEAGYQEMAARLAAAGVRVRIAPVGPAFARVLADAGGSTTAPSFGALYADDGSHPSADGTYLAAAVILGTASGLDPLGFTDGLAHGDRAAYLRRVAHDVLADPRWR
jgi:hypothetical protein